MVDLREKERDRETETERDTKRDRETKRQRDGEIKKHLKLQHETRQRDFTLL